MVLHDGMKTDNYKIYIGLDLLLVKDFNIESNIESNMLCFNLRLNFEHISLFGNPTIDILPCLKARDSLKGVLYPIQNEVFYKNLILIRITIIISNNC